MDTSPDYWYKHEASTNQELDAAKPTNLRYQDKVIQELLPSRFCPKGEFFFSRVR